MIYRPSKHQCFHSASASALPIPHPLNAIAQCWYTTTEQIFFKPDAKKENPAGQQAELEGPVANLDTHPFYRNVQSPGY